MGTVGQRRRNRARRMRAKELKTIKKKWDISFGRIFCICVASCIVYSIIYDNIRMWQLCDRGEITTGFIYTIIDYDNSGGSARGYEFYLNYRRYEGVCSGGKLGDYIEIKYLPENPTKNRRWSELEKRPLYKLYTKIKQKRDGVE